MTATFRRSRAQQKAAKTRRKVYPRTLPNEPPPTEFFTPTSPEPTPFYSFLEDWNRGVIPSNSVLLQFLDSWNYSPILTGDPSLSPAGMSLVTDLKALSTLLIRIIKERNKDELIQRFIGHLRLTGRMIRNGPRSGRITVVEDLPNRRRIKIFGRRDAQIRSELQTKRSTVRQDARDLINLGQLIITSTDFRKVIMEIQKLTRRAVELRGGSGKEKEKEKGNAPFAGGDSTFIRDGERATTRSFIGGRTMPLSQPAVNSGRVEVEFLGHSDELHRRIERTEAEIKELKTQPQSASSGVTNPVYLVRPPTIEIYEPNTTRLKSYEAITPEQTTIGGSGGEAAVGFDKTFETTEKMDHKSKLGAEPIETSKAAKSSSPKDADIEELLSDAKVLLQSLGGNEEFRKSITGIWTILTRWQQQATNLPGTVLASDIRYDANFTAAQQDLLVLAERFSNGKSLQPLIDGIRSFQQEATKDYELNDFLLDWRAFLLTCTSNPNYMEHDEYRRRGRFLLERTIEYADKKYRRLFQENFEQLNSFLNGWQNDKLTAEIGRIVSRIVNQDIFGQAEGGAPARGLFNLATMQTSLLTDLRNIILPALLRSLYELPLPHMEIEQGSMKIALDNMLLPATMFTPADLDLRTTTALHLTPRKGIFNGPSKRKSKRSVGPNTASGAHLSLAGMKGDISNVRFALDRATWPRIRDNGVVDIRLGGKGLSVTVDILTDISPASRRFHIEPILIRVNLDRLSLKFYDVSHETFFNLAKPYLQYLMKSRIEKALCDRIVGAISFVDRLAGRLAKGAGAATII